MQYGLVQVQGNDELAAEEERARQESEAQEQRVESQLAAHIRRAWERAHQARSRTELRLLANIRQRNGEYDTDKLEAIRKQGGSEIYMMLTAVKCRAAKSWVSDILTPAGDRPWTLEPSSEPEISPQMEQAIQQRLMQDARQFVQATGQAITPQQMEQVGQQVREKIRTKARELAEQGAERMASTIEDQLVDAGWSSEFNDIVSDCVDHGTCIIKGPIVTKSQKLRWMQDEQGRTHAQPGEELAPGLRRVDPFNAYPAPGALTPQDGDFIERHRLYRSNLYDLIGVPGYDEQAIRAVLRENSEGGLRDWLTWTLDSSRDRANREDDTSLYGDERIDALEFWGSIPGSKLQAWGMPVEQVPDPEREYDAHAWLIGRHVIKAELNSEPLGRKPYGKACYQEVTGSFWGQGVPELIRDCQDVCNAAARSVVNNMAMASGPMGVVDMKALAPGESANDVFPWRMWQVDYSKMDGASTQKAVEFFQPNPIVESLMAIYDRFSREAEEQSGVPAYTHGSTEVSGAGRTASGLSMLMNAASKGIKNVVKHLDDGVIEPTVRGFYVFNMLYNPDESIKGDLRPVPRGALSLVAKEQTQMRRQEFLEGTANEIDYNIIGPVGRAAVLREVAKGLDMPASDVVPDKEELIARLEAQAQQAQAQQEQEQQQGQGGAQNAKRSREADAAGNPMGAGA